MVVTQDIASRFRQPQTGGFAKGPRNRYAWRRSRAAWSNRAWRRNFAPAVFVYNHNTANTTTHGETTTALRQSA